jgi:hypothetical protein
VIVVLIAAASLVAAPAAFASYLPAAKAKHAEHKFMRGLCRHDKHCKRFGTLHCKRESASRIKCKSWEEGKDHFGKYTCTLRHRWTAKGDRLYVKSLGSPKCVGGWGY